MASVENAALCEMAARADGGAQQVASEQALTGTSSFSPQIQWRFNQQTLAGR